MYTVLTGSEEQKFDTRIEAVEHAKEVSEKTFRRVRVLNDGRFERLIFHRGNLRESLFLTRDKRRHRNLS